MYMIKLQLSSPNVTLDSVRHITGLDELSFDETYGITLISPKRGLYVVRVMGDIDIDKIRAIPEVIEVYGETRISQISK